MPDPAIPPQRPFLGFGLGLRAEHYETVLDEHPSVDWFEVISENYLVGGGKPLYYLDQVRERYPIVMHGVSMSPGSSDPMDQEYLRQLKQLADRVRPEWISDHLCWTGINGTKLHDLMPLPYTEEAVRHVVERIDQVQDYLGRQILIENVSSYVTYRQSEMSEWEFLGAVATHADCLILLDINNIYVSAFNHEFDPYEYLANVPAERVWQHHLAGHSNEGNYIVDTHDESIIDPVWGLYADAVRRFGSVSTMIERDDNIPELGELFAELQHARNIHDSILEDSVA